MKINENPKLFDSDDEINGMYFFFMEMHMANCINWEWVI